MSAICDDGERRLHELRIDEWSDLLLAAVTMASALVAAYFNSQLTLPLFVGAMASLLLSGRAFFRRLDLVDELLLDQKAYVIPEIGREAKKAASMESRRDLAATIRGRLRPVPRFSTNPRVAAVATELQALVLELEDDELELDPLSAIRCRQLLDDYSRSPLLNDRIPAEDAASWIRRVRFGFERRPRTR